MIRCNAANGMSYSLTGRFLLLRLHYDTKGESQMAFVAEASLNPHPTKGDRFQFCYWHNF